MLRRLSVRRSKSSVAESVARLQRGRFATTHQPIGAQLRSHVTCSGSAVAVGMMRFTHVFLEVEISTETSRADCARERLDVAVRMHVKRQVVHLYTTW